MLINYMLILMPTIYNNNCSLYNFIVIIKQIIHNINVEIYVDRRFVFRRWQPCLYLDFFAKQMSNIAVKNNFNNIFLVLF